MMTKTKTRAVAWRATASALNSDQTTNKQPCVRRKVNKENLAQTEDAAQLIFSSICLTMTNEKRKQEDADM